MHYFIQNLYEIIIEMIKSILSRLICLEYSAFMEDQSIIDNVIIIQKYMHDLYQVPVYRDLMVIKLDVE